MGSGASAQIETAFKKQGLQDYVQPAAEWIHKNRVVAIDFQSKDAPALEDLMNDVGMNKYEKARAVNAKDDILAHACAVPMEMDQALQMEMDQNITKEESEVLG